MTEWTAADLPSFAGRTVIVTGANSGLGLITARELTRGPFSRYATSTRAPRLLGCAAAGDETRHSPVVDRTATATAAATSGTATAASGRAATGSRAPTTSTTGLAISVDTASTARKFEWPPP
jgi:NAD(P)-dependent dehydrogenase (short-subunit alcohol dehydrogenase family)